MIIGLDGRVLLEPFPSGVSRISAEIFRRLITASPEWQFRLFVSGARAEVIAERTAEFVSLPNVQVCAVHRSNRWLNLVIGTVGRPYLDDLIEKVDVWFTPNIAFVRLRSTPLVLLVHDMTFLLYGELLKPYTRLWRDMIRPHQLISQAAAVVVPSQHTAGRVRQDVRDMIPERIQVIPFGPPTLPRLSPEVHAQVRRQFSLPPDYAVVIGTLEPRKNIRTILDAWRSIPVVVVGAHGGYVHTPKQGVRYVGYVSEEEKWSLLQQARMLVYPSLAEGFGLPVLEAFAAHVPVLAGPHTALVEVGKDAVLWTNVHNQAAMAQAVQVLLTDDRLRQRLIQAGDRVLSLYSWERTITSLRAVLQHTYENRH